MTFKCHYSWFYIIHKVQWHNWNLLLIHLIPFSHFFKYFSKKHNLIWPYFECFKVSKLINLLELYFDTYFWMDFASVLCTIFEQLLPTKWRLPNNRNKCGVKHSYTNNGENNLSKAAQNVTQNTQNTCNIYHKLNVKVNFKVSEVWMTLLLHACCHNENSQLISPCCLHSVVYSKLQPAQSFIKWLKYLVCVSKFSLPCFPFYYLLSK